MTVEPGEVFLMLRSLCRLRPELKGVEWMVVAALQEALLLVVSSGLACEPVPESGLRSGELG